MGKVLSHGQPEGQKRADELIKKIYRVTRDRDAYCQWLRGNTCIMTSNESCKKCKFFSAGLYSKKEILAEYAGKAHAENTKLKAENEELRKRNEELENQLKVYKYV